MVCLPRLRLGITLRRIVSTWMWYSMNVEAGSQAIITWNYALFKRFPQQIEGVARRVAIELWLQTFPSSLEWNWRGRVLIPAGWRKVRDTISLLKSEGNFMWPTCELVDGTSTMFMLNHTRGLLGGEIWGLKSLPASGPKLFCPVIHLNLITLLIINTLYVRNQ